MYMMHIHTNTQTHTHTHTHTHSNEQRGMTCISTLRLICFKLFDILGLMAVCRLIANTHTHTHSDNTFIQTARQTHAIYAQSTVPIFACALFPFSISFSSSSRTERAERGKRETTREREGEDKRRGEKEIERRQEKREREKQR